MYLRAVSLCKLQCDLKRYHTDKCNHEAEMYW